MAEHPDIDLIGSFNRQIDVALRAALDGATTVALVNFPNHGNPGDPSIWLGACAALSRLGVRVSYQCAVDTFSAAALRRAVPEGPVLLNGGGNFGDLYAGQQDLRERLLTELRDVPLVQLPQTIYFQHDENLERMRRLVDDHERFTLMVREQRSYDAAVRHFDAPVALVPDLAFALGPLERIGDPSVDVTWLLWRRGAAEFLDHGGPPKGVSSRTVDWITPSADEPRWSPWHRAHHRVNEWARPRLRDDPRVARLAWRPFGATFTPLSTAWVDRGVRILSSGRVVVTDKLHGHILAMLTGIPHVVLDNSYGKVSAVYETFTSPSATAHFAADGDEARRRALELVEGAR